MNAPSASIRASVAARDTRPAVDVTKAHRDQRGLTPVPARAADAVRYSSRGRVLVIGAEADALAAAGRLRASGLECLVIASPIGVPEGDRAVRGTGVGITVVRSEIGSLTGHLGAFQVRIRVGGAPGQAGGPEAGDGLFDLVLDLSSPPLLRAELPPPGYFSPGADAGRLEAALAELPTLVGEFEKPRFYDYDPSICAHGARGLSGCTRCIDACPTQAIGSIGERIAVDPFLCQGGGTCAAVCPSGAIRYRIPPPSSMLGRLKEMLRGQGQGLARRPLILFYGRESAADWLHTNAASIPEDLIPMELEEVGATGLETWLCAIAYGAGSVALLLTPDTPPSVRRALTSELATGRRLLEAMGYPPECLSLVDGADIEPGSTPLLAARRHSVVEIPVASFQAFDEKRTNFFLALDHLYAHAPTRVARVGLDAGAPFGNVAIDQGRCTLCMACVAVCPTRALGDGDDAPRLDFFEANCVQCGLCVTACPEQALSLDPRMTFDLQSRRRPRVLNEEKPFCCVSCGRPFATQSMMGAVTAKLAGHWMYQEASALRRLQMCQDCRVRDMFSTGHASDPPPKAEVTDVTQ